jgi:hypothetical protein
LSGKPDENGDQIQSGYSIDKAVAYLNKTAHASYLDGTGHCAEYVVNAMINKDGGGSTSTKYRRDAKDDGAFLEETGFKPIQVTDENYDAQKGDVVIIQPRNGLGNKSGHMMMYSGSQWVSDHKQSGFWPWQTLGDPKPTFTVYRYTPETTPDQ